MKLSKRNMQNKESKELSCQICQAKEAVLEIKGSWYLNSVQGRFCENCAVERIRAGGDWSAEKEERVRVKMRMKVSIERDIWLEKREELSRKEELGRLHDKKGGNLIVKKVKKRYENIPL